MTTGLLRNAAVFWKIRCSAHIGAKQKTCTGRQSASFNDYEVSRLLKWALKDLNLRPKDYESSALTAELRARYRIPPHCTVQARGVRKARLLPPEKHKPRDEDVRCSRKRQQSEPYTLTSSASRRTPIAQDPFAYHPSCSSRVTCQRTRQTVRPGSPVRCAQCHRRALYPH